MVAMQTPAKDVMSTATGHLQYMRRAPIHAFFAQFWLKKIGESILKPYRAHAQMLRMDAHKAHFASK